MPQQNVTSALIKILASSNRQVSSSSVRHVEKSMLASQYYALLKTRLVGRYLGGLSTPAVRGVILHSSTHIPLEASTTTVQPIQVS